MSELNRDQDENGFRPSAQWEHHGRGRGRDVMSDRRNLPADGSTAPTVHLQRGVWRRRARFGGRCPQWRNPMHGKGTTRENVPANESERLVSRGERARASQSQGGRRFLRVEPRVVVRGPPRPTATDLLGSSDRAGAAVAFTLDELSALEPEILVRRVDCQLKDFLVALGTIRPKSLDYVIEILIKLVNLASRPEGTEQSMASKIIAEILNGERCVQFHFYVNCAVKSCSCTVKQIQDLCVLFHSMLTKFQSLAWDCLPIDELYETVKRSTEESISHTSDFIEKVEELCKMRDQIRNACLEMKSKVDRDNSKFRLIPILPEWEEIKEDNGISDEVRPNKISVPYKDWMEYYDIQFRLIREDFIAPLRRGVAAFLQGERGRKNRDVHIYRSAKIFSQVTMKGRGICFRVKFDVSSLQEFIWENSKRLQFGSLLCFIPMGSVARGDAAMFAIVADDNIAELKEGKIFVNFKRDPAEVIAHIRDKTMFEIVESTLYFEAFGPILYSLQNSETETMPFTTQFIRGECNEILSPVYLCANEDVSPIMYDLSCLNGPEREYKLPLMIEVLDKESWEAARDSELDSSQLNAIQTALTQEIAVIQGPPGTGKTYIGLKIVEGLLDNRPIWDPHRSSPILVMCYTNHALDQFLEGIIDTKCCGRELKVIRVGNQCKNEKVDAFNLSKVRKEYSYSNYVI